MTHIEGSVALVTGANRGLGKVFAERLLDRGASKVYATAREASSITVPGVETMELDVTDPAAIERAVQQAQDVTLVVNNAGINTFSNLVTGDLTKVRSELDVHLWGALEVIRGFAPVLAGNGGGAIVNVLSAMSWFPYLGSNAYHVAKAAEWAMTNGVRLELADQGTLVTGVHLGTADTDLTAGFDGFKLAPRLVVDTVLDGVDDGLTEVLVDDWSRAIKAGLAGAPASAATV